MSTFVSVGNATQPFTRLLEAVARIATQLPQPVIIQYGAASGFTAPKCQCVDYLGMEDFAHHVSAAEVLILHAGAGSVIHAIRAGKVPVIVPRQAAFGEHVDDHQLEFARELLQLGKVVVCRNIGDLQTCVHDALRRQIAKPVAASVPPLVSALDMLLREHVLWAAKR